MPKAVVSEYNNHERKGTLQRPLGVVETREMIVKISNIYPRTTLIIDALDETDKATQQTLLGALRDIIATSKRIVSVFVSSKYDGDIGRGLGNPPRISVSASDNKGDIERFVLREIERAINQGRLLGGEVPKDLKRHIESTLVNKAMGMYVKTPSSSYSLLSLIWPGSCGLISRSNTSADSISAQMSSRTWGDYQKLYKRHTDSYTNGFNLPKAVAPIW